MNMEGTLLPIALVAKATEIKVPLSPEVSSPTCLVPSLNNHFNSGIKVSIDKLRGTTTLLVTES